MKSVIFRLSLVLAVTLFSNISQAASENSSIYRNTLNHDACYNFTCENSGQCQTILSNVDGQMIKRAECICHDRWIGPHCESLLVLTPRRITEYSVELRITLQNSNRTEQEPDNFLKYTLQYWTNGSDTSCYKIPEITNLTYEISDLISGVYYNFCARTNLVGQCPTYNLDPNSLTSNCIGILTHMAFKNSHNMHKNVPLILPIVICTILGVLSFVAILIVCKCHGNLTSCHCSRIGRCCMKWSHQPSYNLFILPDNTSTAVNNQTPLITDERQHQSRSMVLPMDSSNNSSHPLMHSSFPLPPDFDITEENLEKTSSLIPPLPEQQPSSSSVTL
ncbi:uncharacterized protein LOC115215930, partial [Argonauta hians]